MGDEGFNVIEQQLRRAEECARESAEIMRRARGRADTYKQEMEQALVDLSRLLEAVKEVLDGACGHVVRPDGGEEYRVSRTALDRLKEVVEGF